MFVKKLLFKKNNPKFQKNKQIFVQKQQKLILFYLLRKNINAKNKNFRDIQPLPFVIKKVKSRIKNNKFFFFSSRQKTKPKKRSKLKVSRKRGPWLPKKKYLKLRKKRKKQYKLIRKFNKKFFGFLLRRRRHRWVVKFFKGWLNKKKLRFYLLKIRYKPLFKNYFWRRYKKANWRKLFLFNKKTHVGWTQAKNLIFKRAVFRWRFFLYNSKRFVKHQKRAWWFGRLIKQLTNRPFRKKFAFQTNYYLKRLFKSVFNTKTLFLLRKERLHKLKLKYRFAHAGAFFYAFFISSIGVFLYKANFSSTTRWSRTFIKYRFVNLFR